MDYRRRGQTVTSRPWVLSDSQSLLPAEMKSADTFYRHVQQVGSDSLGFPG